MSGVTRHCDSCGRAYEAQRANSRFCGGTCRKRNFRGATPAPSVEHSTSPLVIATRGELEAAGKLDTMLGQQALALAARMSGTQTSAGVASLSRELRTVMTAAIGSLSSTNADVVDELKRRRDAKRASQ